MYFQRKHRALLEEAQVQSTVTVKQPTLTSLVTTPKKYNPSDPRQIELTDTLVSFVAGDLLPLSLVESKRFRKLMDKADPRYQLPSRKHLTSKLLPAKITKTQADLMARLKKADKVCATIDLWSSMQMRSYFGVTGHFIVDWALESVMLGCIRFRGSHTADAIAEQFSTTAATYDLNDKISHRQLCQHAQSIFTPWFRDHSD